jgi:hypothetical protein
MHLKDCYVKVTEAVVPGQVMYGVSPRDHVMSGSAQRAARPSKETRAGERLSSETAQPKSEIKDTSHGGNNDCPESEDEQASGQPV